MTTEPDPHATLPLVELFGPTVQGEGPRAGQRAAFVRLGRCNLACAACDTPYAWDSTRYRMDDEITMVEVGKLLVDLIVIGMNLPLSLVVLTGGEPLLHQQRPALRTLVEQITGNVTLDGDRMPACTVQVETNGTVIPSRWLLDLVDAQRVHLVASPKVTGPLATDLLHKRIRPNVIRVLASTPSTVFKLVAATAADVVRIDAFAGQYGIDPDRVWVMPAGATPDELATSSAQVADAVTHYGFNVSPRLQVMLWPGERGR